jgi:hypothetical protein
MHCARDIKALSKSWFVNFVHVFVVENEAGSIVRISGCILNVVC